MNKLPSALLWFALAFNALAKEPAALPPAAEAALTADFAQRDAMPESPIPKDQWYLEKRQGTWGPKPSVYPLVNAPANCDPILWKRARVIAVAKHYLGLPYQHHHIPGWKPPASWTSLLGAPETPGLDCSNFTTWVYNYGLGILFTSAIGDQSDGPKAPGRKLAPGEPFTQGDLLFILLGNRSAVSHVVIWMDADHIIDAHAGSIQIRPFRGWYKTHLSHARRIIE